MLQERVARGLKEKTGKHYCTVCLQETPAEEYFAYDHVCGGCAKKEGTFPLASTPDAPRPSGETAGKQATLPLEMKGEESSG